MRNFAKKTKISFNVMNRTDFEAEKGKLYSLLKNEAFIFKTRSPLQCSKTLSINFTALIHIFVLINMYIFELINMYIFELINMYIFEL